MLPRMQPTNTVKEHRRTIPQFFLQAPFWNPFPHACGTQGVTYIRYLAEVYVIYDLLVYTTKVTRALIDQFGIKTAIDFFRKII